MNWITSTGLELFKDAVLAVIAAWFAVRISLKKFSSQRWWERQEEAYRGIIEALSEILYCLGHWEGDLLHIKELSDSKSNEIFSSLQKQRDTISRVSHEGAFRISEKSSNALSELRKELEWHSADYDQMNDLDHWWGAVIACREVIYDEAKKDLQINKQKKIFK